VVFDVDVARKPRSRLINHVIPHLLTRVTIELAMVLVWWQICSSRTVGKSDMQYDSRTNGNAKIPLEYESNDEVCKPKLRRIAFVHTYGRIVITFCKTPIQRPKQSRYSALRFIPNPHSTTLTSYIVIPVGPGVN